MGAGGEKKPMREIAETKAAAKEEAFSAIIEKVKMTGGEIISDETAPLFIEVGSQEFEVGEQRIVEFNLNRLDIRLTRNSETHVLSGSGHQKHIEELKMPKINISMKRKQDTSNEWQVVDLEDMF